MNNRNKFERAGRAPLAQRALHWLGWVALLGAIYAVQCAREGRPLPLPAPLVDLHARALAGWRALTTRLARFARSASRQDTRTQGGSSRGQEG